MAGQVSNTGIMGRTVKITTAAVGERSTATTINSEKKNEDDIFAELKRLIAEAEGIPSKKRNEVLTLLEAAQAEPPKSKTARSYIERATYILKTVGDSVSSLEKILTAASKLAELC
ncbi:hypothetical protein [Achromobacter deleyi]|uniref:hypothetical protein n=1 Tax=Achromobacter deleyi TaxID=1353891 RepID=UPI001490E697|nr:hypothetical protein [Achromobacter deleyi]QVQ26989.1 hypothetical protein HLG70_00550 [Achromobacter deleyi]UIP22568.1 hypothetical protein LYZ39_08650 [Achromobacter deleyi]